MDDVILAVNKVQEINVGIELKRQACSRPIYEERLAKRPNYQSYREPPPCSGGGPQHLRNQPTNNTNQKPQVWKFKL